MRDVFPGKTAAQSVKLRAIHPIVAPNFESLQLSEALLNATSVTTVVELHTSD